MCTELSNLTLGNTYKRILHTYWLSIKWKFVFCWHKSSILEQWYKGNSRAGGGTTPLILTPRSVSLMKWLLYPQRKNHLAPNQQNNEWYSQTVWTFWRRGKSLAPGRIWTLDHPTCRLTFYQICYVLVLTCTLPTNVTAVDNDCGTVLGMLLEIPFLIFLFF
jgi:hypothetical protein